MYRIWNKIEKRYNNDYYISQDGKSLTKENWIMAIPLTNDFRVEKGLVYNGGIYYENDIVRCDDEVGIIKRNKFNEFIINDIDLKEYEVLDKLGNINENDIIDYLGKDEDEEYQKLKEDGRI